MPGSSDHEQSAAAPHTRAAYLDALRTHAHELLYMGYSRLNASDQHDAEEPDITGLLSEAMQEALEDEAAPSWVEHYSLKEDPPLSVLGRTGKHRPRVDIGFERVQRGKRPRLRFEAKRLARSHPVGKYLGKDGLGCFLSGWYPVAHGEAGMLGYVQSEDEATWAAKIEAELSAKPTHYAVACDGHWVKQAVTPSLEHTYRTGHALPGTHDRITIHHVLLRFCP